MTPSLTPERYRSAVRRYWALHVGALVMVLAVFGLVMVDDSGAVGLDWALVMGSLLTGLICVAVAQRLVRDLSCPHCGRGRPERTWQRETEAGLSEVSFSEKKAHCIQCGHNPRRAKMATLSSVARPVPTQTRKVP